MRRLQDKEIGNPTSSERLANGNNTKSERKLLYVKNNNILANKSCLDLRIPVHKHRLKIRYEQQSISKATWRGTQKLIGFMKPRAQQSSLKKRESVQNFVLEGFMFVDRLIMSRLLD